MVKTDLFSTIQFPFNFIEDAAKNELHVEAKKRDVAVLAMKPFAGGVIDNAAVAFAFLRQFPDVIPLAGFDSSSRSMKSSHLPSGKQGNIAGTSKSWKSIAQNWASSSAVAANTAMPCPNGVFITPAMGYKLFVSRMSPAVAVDFAKVAMESVHHALNVKSAFPAALMSCRFRSTEKKTTNCIKRIARKVNDLQ